MAEAFCIISFIGFTAMNVIAFYQFLHYLTNTLGD